MTSVEKHIAVCFAVALGMAVIFMLGIQLGIRKGRRLALEEIATKEPVTFYKDNGAPQACMPWVQYERLVDGGGE